jgi:hypothetical protein
MAIMAMMGIIATGGHDDGGSDSGDERNGNPSPTPDRYDAASRRRPGSRCASLRKR